MRLISIITIITIFLSANSSFSQDWRNYEAHTNFERYSADNKRVISTSAESRVVFMGNSITEAWPVVRPQFFENSNYIGRGISGQTTPQILLRFREDVINLDPEVVVILAGINDIAGNTGFTPVEKIAENLFSMVELAQQNDIKVVLCSVLPAIEFPWNPGLEPANKVLELNTLLKKYARENNLGYVDYHSALKDDENGLRVPEYTSEDDLVHPNEAGYIIMESLVQPAIDKALSAVKFKASSLFQDHMVLQQKENITIWGNAHGVTKVTASATWGDATTTTSDAAGNWKLELTTPQAGGPYLIDLTSGENSILLRDVMIGEVWLASGQSNMEMYLRGWPPTDTITNSANEIASASYSDIRMLTVQRAYSLDEEKAINGSWKVCSPLTSGEYSATAYFFAKRLYQELQIPIGIIHSSWGGTPAESWVSKGQIKELGDFDELITAINDPQRETKTKAWYDQWETKAIPSTNELWEKLDLGQTVFADPNYDDKQWQTVKLPGRFDDISGQDINGVFWLRKKIELSSIESDFSFHLGAVDDTDLVFFNGEKIGGMANSYSTARMYKVNKHLLKKGTNCIAIRAIDTAGPGTVNAEMKLANENETISLAGEWQIINTAEFYSDKIYLYDLDRINTIKRPNILHLSPFTPSVLFNAMIKPLVPYTIKGAIWYQGESNVGRAKQYARLFPTMINDWREQWKAKFPFYFVQIAPYTYNQSGDVTMDLSQKLRDAQRKTLALENTGMVVTLDIGDNKNIHPANKGDVGYRLAGLALANEYGKDLVPSGPLYRSVTINGNKAELDFDYIGSGLMAKKVKLEGFEVAGPDGNFVPAQAVIKGDKVVVSSSGVPTPKEVRYAWSDTASASLFNKEGLPASSFTTEEE